MKLTKAITIAFFVSHSIVSLGATRTAVANGNWTSSSSWDCGCVPNDNDNIIIPSGIKITIPWPGVDMIHPTVITVTVYGELVLSSSTLSLNSADIVNIPSGGKISTTGLGGLVTSGFTPIASFPINGPATISNGALPIVLNYFNAVEESSGVMVKWESGLEENLARYVVERSVDGLSFEDIGSIAIFKNHSEPTAYTFLDEHPRVGRSYYRLRTEDFDGATETFNVVSVFVSKEAAEIQAYPNPLVNGILTLDPNISFTSGDYLLVTTSLGKPVLKIMLSGFRSSFDLSALEAGVYYLECRTAFGTFKKRLIKQ